MIIKMGYLAKIRTTIHYIIGKRSCVSEVFGFEVVKM